MGKGYGKRKQNNSVMQSCILWIFSCKINEGHMELYRKLLFMNLQILQWLCFFPCRYWQKAEQYNSKK